MIRKFNLALIPLTKNAEAVALAKKLSSLADLYQLGERSLAHVTICQFMAEETDLENIWREASKIVSNSLHLKFDTLSYLSYDNETYWVSLLPNKISTLKSWYKPIAQLVKTPINDYDPHLTLINTKAQAPQTLVTELTLDFGGLEDQFVLALGECDTIGQFTKLLYSKKSEQASFTQELA